MLPTLLSRSLCRLALAVTRPTLTRLNKFNSSALLNSSPRCLSTNTTTTKDNSSSTSEDSSSSDEEDGWYNSNSWSNDDSLPTIGQELPSIKLKALLPDGSISNLALSNYRGKWVLLFAWPYDFTFVCPTEIIAFSDRAHEFEKREVQLLGFSCDSVYSHKAWTKMKRTEGGLEKVNFPILSDMNKVLSGRLGILDEKQGVPYRVSLLIDPQGKLRQLTLNDFGVGRSVDEALRLVDAYQFHEKHGEVCPADYKLGGQAINTKSDATISEYFKRAATKAK